MFAFKSKFLVASDLQRLAEEFAQSQNFDRVEGRCAELAKAFSAFLTAKHVPNKIVDARDYNGPLKSVGGSNHVLATVNGEYADFTAKQFDPSAPEIQIGRVAELSGMWGVVNQYNSYADFLSNFSKEQR